MLRILETELISDFADGFAGVEYFFLTSSLKKYSFYN